MLLPNCSRPTELLLTAVLEKSADWLDRPVTQKSLLLCLKRRSRHHAGFKMEPTCWVTTRAAGGGVNLPQRSDWRGRDVEGGVTSQLHLPEVLLVWRRRLTGRHGRCVQRVSYRTCNRAVRTTQNTEPATCFIQTLQSGRSTGSVTPVKLALIDVSTCFNFIYKELQ